MSREEHDERSAFPTKARLTLEGQVNIRESKRKKTKGVEGRMQRRVNRERAFRRGCVSR